MPRQQQLTSEKHENRRGAWRGEEEQTEHTQTNLPPWKVLLLADPHLARSVNAEQRAALLQAGQQVLGNRVVQRLLHADSEQVTPPVQGQVEEEEATFQAKELPGQSREVPPAPVEAAPTPNVPGYMIGQEVMFGPGPHTWEAIASKRLPGVQRRAPAALIGRVQGNQHLQRVVESLERNRTMAPLAQTQGQEVIQRYTIRPARAGELYHLKTGTLSEEKALDEEIQVESATWGRVEQALAKDPELKLLKDQVDEFCPDGEAVFHRVHKIMPDKPHGEHHWHKPDQKSHIAIADSGANRLESVLSHELFHAFRKALLQFEMGPEGLKLRKRRKVLKLAFPADLEQALMKPHKNTLATKVGANRPYQFGWFEIPGRGLWTNLGDFRTLKRLRVVTTNPDYYDEGYRKACAEWITKIRENKEPTTYYEKGIRVMETPEEDLTESFEL
jgi:hypothetical protein